MTRNSSARRSSWVERSRSVDGLAERRCLTEGVDIPAVDCVLFADPKQSVIDIVQAAGRALRRHPGKEHGYILLPLVVPSGVDLDAFAETTAFRQVARTIAALSTQDERIAEEFRVIEHGRRPSGQIVEIEGDVPVGLRLELGEFVEAIRAQIWERVGRANWRPFEDARSFARSQGLRSAEGLEEFTKSGRLPADIPAKPEPDLQGRGLGRLGRLARDGTVASSSASIARSRRPAPSPAPWGSGRGRTGGSSSSPAGFLPTFRPTRRDLQGRGLGRDGRLARDRNHCHLPAPVSPVRGGPLLRPRPGAQVEEGVAGVRQVRPASRRHSGQARTQTYKDAGWAGMGDWLGTGTIATHLRQYRPFEEARAFARSLGLRSGKEWKEFTQSGRLPADIPASPSKTYKDAGWAGMGDWLGTGTVAPHLRQYRPFEEARAFARSLGLRSVKEWRQFAQSGRLPADIPAAQARPTRTRAGPGWATGSGRERSRLACASTARSRRPALSPAPWGSSRGRSGGSSPSPAGSPPTSRPARRRPTRTRAGPGWATGSGPGTVAPHLRQYRPFEEARAFARSLGAQVGEGVEGVRQVRPAPRRHPGRPERGLQGRGLGRDGATGSGRGLSPRCYANTARSRRPAHSLAPWGSGRQRSGGSSPDPAGCPTDIPANPTETYKDAGWAGMGDWLGTGTVANYLTPVPPVRGGARVCPRSWGSTQRKPGGVRQIRPAPRRHPGSPRAAYKDKGWVSWGDWLGHSPPPAAPRPAASPIAPAQLELGSAQSRRARCTEGQQEPPSRRERLLDLTDDVPREAA